MFEFAGFAAVADRWNNRGLARWNDEGLPRAAINLHWDGTSFVARHG
jgi:hypothetical protein